jgi:DNA-binding winged helix-turn-helix (wHTH) protein
MSLAGGLPIGQSRLAMIFAFDGFEVDAGRLQLRRGGKVLKVDAPVLRLLLALLRNAGQLVAKEDLVAEVWEGRSVTDNVITVAMARLRKVLAAGQGRDDFVSTAYGRGYSFVRPVVVRSSATDSASGHTAAPELPYVGRERVLTRLREAAAEAREGRGRVCVLMGEPGIGKTRALEMLERELNVPTASTKTPFVPMRVAWAYCQQGQTPPPLFPWQQLLREIVGAADDGPLAAGIAASLKLTERFHFTDAPVTATQAAADAPDDAARHRVFAELLQSFTRATSEGPWLLVLDDMQGADAASLELMSHLLDRVARLPLLVVATLRATQAGLPERNDPLLARILGHRNCERIALERLAAGDVANYVRALLDDPQGRLSRAVFEKSEGNPFFMTELSRQLRDMDEPRPEALAVPDAALDLLRQRVAQVNTKTRGLLSACAVLGRSFELGTLAELVRCDADALVEDLDAAQRADVLYCEAGSRTSFVFSHELIRAVLYDGLSGSERRQLHLRVAEVLERRLGLGEAIHMSELAHHAHAALPLGDLHKTVRFCRAAAEVAVPVFAFRDVASYARHGLEALLLMERPSVRLRMSLLYLTALFSRPHDPSGYQQCVDELTRLGREHENGEMLVRAAALMHAHPALKPLPHVRPVIERGLSLLCEDALGLRAAGTAGLALTSPSAFVGERAEAYAQQAVELARAANSSSAAYYALLAQLHVLGGPRHVERATEIAAQLEALAQQNPVELAVLPVDLAFHAAARALSLGKLAQASAAFDRAVARSKQLHHAELVWHGERGIALLQIAAGEGTRGHDALSALHVRAGQLRLFGTDVFCAYDRVVVLGTASRESGCDDRLRRALAYDPEDAPPVWAMKVRALAKLGLQDDARAALRAVGPGELALLPCDAHYLGTLSHLAHAVVSLGERSYYEVLTRALGAHPDAFTSHVFALADGPVSQALALLAHASGDTLGAVALWELTLERSERAGFALCAAEARRRLPKRSARDRRSSRPPLLTATREPAE